jgi:hypothetical protein
MSPVGFIFTLLLHKFLMKFILNNVDTFAAAFPRLRLQGETSRALPMKPPDWLRRGTEYSVSAQYKHPSEKRKKFLLK